MLDAMIADARICNARARAAGWHEMDWRGMKLAEEVKSRNTLNAEARAQGLPVPKTTEIQRSILAAILGGARNSRSVAKKVGSKYNVISAHVRHMESRGLVTITIHGKSPKKRQWFYSLTDAGRAALRGAQ